MVFIALPFVERHLRNLKGFSPHLSTCPLHPLEIKKELMIRVITSYSLLYPLTKINLAKASSVNSLNRSINGTAMKWNSKKSKRL
jgi:hypothetical protein